MSRPSSFSACSTLQRLPGETGSSLPVVGIDVGLSWLLVLAGLAFLLRGLLSLGSTYAQEAMIQRSGGEVSSLLHRQYLYAPYRFHLRRNSSELVRTAILSVDSASSNVVRPIVTIVTQVPIIVALAALLVIISPVLTIGGSGNRGGCVGADTRGGAIPSQNPRATEAKRSRQRSSKA